MSNLIISELWIGERLRSKITGKVGHFEGIHESGKLRIRAKNKTYLIPIHHLEYYTEEDEIELHFIDHEPETIEFQWSIGQNELDLHIKVLKPSLQNALPERISDIQLKAFLDFLAFCKKNSIKDFLIIHGIGAGVLRHSIHQMLSSEDNIRQFTLENNGGATRILLY